MTAASVTLLLVGCDPVSYGQILIQSKVPIDRRCLVEVQELLSDADVTPEETPSQSGELDVRRGADSISILPSVDATSLTLSFKWLGRSKPDEERSSFELLDEVHAAVRSRCLNKRAQETVRRKCRARLCEEWLASHES